MDIVIIDYGAGNIKSIEFAFKRLGLNVVLTDDIKAISKADKVIFPGVGEASSAMHKLRNSRLDTIIPELKQPVLGICLGMQLLCNQSEENNTQGLGVFNSNVKRFSSKVKVPQIAWNTIYNLKTELFNGIKENEFMYSVHSYYVPKDETSIATSEYDIEYSSAIQKDNFYGVQFHPEKSSKAGAKILENFIKLT